MDHQADEEMFVSVKQQLTKLLKSVLISAPSCLLLPRCWITYEEVLRGCFTKPDAVPAYCFERVARRNGRLVKSFVGQSWRSMPTARQTLITLLDSTTDWAKIAKLTDGCLAAADDSGILVVTCLEWASSSYRHGHARVYTAARILRGWSKKGVELEKPIFDFLANSPGRAGLHKRNAYRLLAELIRSKHFLVGKYLQWLMARGTLTRCGNQIRVSKHDLRRRQCSTDGGRTVLVTYVCSSSFLYTVNRPTYLT